MFENVDERIIAWKLTRVVLNINSNSLKLLTCGIQQVRSSDQFAGVLEYVFHAGNLLNVGEGVEYTKWVKSIAISSLEKLSFTKAYDGRISFLQYVIQSIEVRDAFVRLLHHGMDCSLINCCFT